ncbi:MAG: NAD-glutamate dehydrogenase [Phycisphaerales bacterium]|nr:NAD-glutamate dehydrogenase [Phycisphaerales bacterium]
MSSGLPESRSSADQPCPAEVVEHLLESLRSTSDDVVPWFLDQMPPVYFQDTDEATRLSHLRAIVAARASGRPLELTLRSEDGTQWTSMRPLDYPGVLAELVAELPIDQKLRSAKIHTAKDGSLVIDTFEFGDAPRCDLDDPAQHEKLDEVIAYAATSAPDWSSEDIRDYFTRCAADYVLTITPLRMSKHWSMFKQITGTDSTTVMLEPESDPTFSRISVAVANSTRRVMLERIAERLSHAGINIHRAHLDTVDDGDNGSISFLGFVVTAPDGGPIPEDGRLWARVRHDLKRSKWVDRRAIDLSQRSETIDLTHAELVTALGDLVHQVLCKKNRYAFTSDRIRALAVDNVALTLAICDLLLDRFQPDHPLEDDVFNSRMTALRERIEADVDLEDARMVLYAMVDAVASVLRTNVYLEDRYALALRLDPALLQSEDRPDLPYGIFHVHGRGFNGFHVRFRDIARGGVRAIVPRSTAQFTRENERLYDEAYGLAAAQQLKNKDIPEGGAKAAILVHPDETAVRSVKAFVDSLLDLITPDEIVRSRVVDRLGEPELLYLGPDENITPSMIDWIVERACQRAYPVPTALMSSKPGAGINHKDYGVTSEGVVVFLEAGLRCLGIDPRQQRFSVKMTGGPDGDVGGNAIRIMLREFGDSTCIVGIADGSGCAEDPEGLDHEELMRLVEAEAPISQFDPAKLSASGGVWAIDDADGVRRRNTLHTRLAADAFLPCGGRPSTMHAGNWSEFVHGDTPSSPLIVEGANLFLTPDARAALADKGVVIFKDSSANKCGVICSSYEIIASMLLSPEEFLQVKEQFVSEVLQKLRTLAALEAQQLARMLRQQPGLHLPAASIRLSRAVIRTADALESAMGNMTSKDRSTLEPVIQEHLPPVLLEVAGDRLTSGLPETYRNWLVAKALAAKIVYREGMEAVEAIDAGSVAALAIGFLHRERRRNELADAVASSSLEHRDEIVELLRRTAILPTMQPSEGEGE